MPSIPWSRDEQFRYEDRIARELHEMRGEIRALTLRVSWLLGGIGVMVFVVNLVAPLLQGWIGIQP